MTRSATVSPQVSALLNCLAEPAVMLSTDYRILAVNPAYQHLYGDDRPLTGRTCHAVSHHSPVPCHLAGEDCPLLASVESGQPRRVLHIHHTPQGRQHVTIETRPVIETDGTVSALIEIHKRSALATTRPAPQGLVGRSKAFRQMLELIHRVAPAETSVLLTGESGTGKELAAQAIHDASPRSSGPFVPVECVGLPDSLFESELFGYEKGAFTGASHRKAGLLEAARGGTLFMDEIGDVPPSIQVKLLRLLETRCYRRVGGLDIQQADFRLVCASHHDLAALVEQGRFRADLYYRLAVFPIQLPTLADRQDDLPLLIASLLQRLAPERKVRLSVAAMTALSGYPFPGNIRELRNLLERALLLADSDLIEPHHLPTIDPGSATPAEQPAPLIAAEQHYLAGLLEQFDGNRQALARSLGISERTLYRKLARLRDR